MFAVRILGTAGHLEGAPRTTRELIARAAPDRDPAALEAKVGVRTRRWTDTMPSALGARALAAACEDAGVAPGDLRRVILASSTGGDQIFPATANQLLAELGVADSCDAFDVNNACMGFLTALDLAARSVVTGRDPVGVVCAERASPFLSPDYHRSYLIFGDGAAAVVLGAGQGGGVLGLHLSNNPTWPSSAKLEHAAFGGGHIAFEASNREMTAIAVAALKRAAGDVLDQAGLALADVQWVLPHQPNGRMLDRALEALGARPEQTVRVVEEIGSLGSVAIPFSLDRLLRTRPVKPGDRVLMVGVGTGVACGALLYQVPEC
jgi:3-oxoacyl-[acyl-carrier-protein] synthase-3